MKPTTRHVLCFALTTLDRMLDEARINVLWDMSLVAVTIRIFVGDFFSGLARFPLIQPSNEIAAGAPHLLCRIALKIPWLDFSGATLGGPFIRSELCKKLGGKFAMVSQAQGGTRPPWRSDAEHV